MPVILHVLAADDWATAQANGSYGGDTLDRDGFIHCCTPAQLAHVLATYFPGLRGLLALHIQPEDLAAELRWEESGPGSPYPHIYGPLNLDAVLAVQELP